MMECAGGAADLPPSNVATTTAGNDKTAPPNYVVEDAVSRDNTAAQDPGQTRAVASNAEQTSAVLTDPVSVSSAPTNGQVTGFAPLGIDTFPFGFNLDAMGSVGGGHVNYGLGNLPLNMGGNSTDITGATGVAALGLDQLLNIVGLDTSAFAAAVNDAAAQQQPQQDSTMACAPILQVDSEIHDSSVSSSMMAPSTEIPPSTEGAPTERSESAIQLQNDSALDINVTTQKDQESSTTTGTELPSSENSSESKWSPGDYLVVRCDSRDPFWVAAVMETESKSTDQEGWLQIRRMDFSSICEDGEVYKVGYWDHIPKSTVLCKTKLLQSNIGFVLPRDERFRIMKLIQNSENDEMENKTDNFELEVGAILSKAVLQDGKLYYLIRWKGFDERNTTWEPAGTQAKGFSVALKKFEGAVCKLVVTFPGNKPIAPAKRTAAPPRSRQRPKKSRTDTVGDTNGSSLPGAHPHAPQAAAKGGRKKTLLDKLRAQGPPGWRKQATGKPGTPGTPGAGKKPAAPATGKKPIGRPRGSTVSAAAQKRQPDASNLGTVPLTSNMSMGGTGMQSGLGMQPAFNCSSTVLGVHDVESPSGMMPNPSAPGMVNLNTTAECLQSPYMGLPNTAPSLLMSQLQQLPSLSMQSLVGMPSNSTASNPSTNITPQWDSTSSVFSLQNADMIVQMASQLAASGGLSTTPTSTDMGLGFSGVGMGLSGLGLGLPEGVGGVGMEMAPNTSSSAISPLLSSPPTIATPTASVMPQPPPVSSSVLPRKFASQGKRKPPSLQINKNRPRPSTEAHPSDSAQTPKTAPAAGSPGGS
ncbi:hypothetical protein Pelo_14460 [Pelomyxa schiedti]|nr:hypothetical protein Pelo_14460 [Pelomyxa schiedti]